MSILMSDRIFVSRLRLPGGLSLDIECGLDRAAGEAAGPEALSALAAEIAVVGSVDTLGPAIADAILARFYAVSDVMVRVRLPGGPDAAFEQAGVEIRRPRRRRIGLSLGSNMGNKVANLQTALSLLRTENVVEFDAISRLYRTEPWGNEDQDWFVNACATGWTTLSPQEVLKACKRVEFKVGRVPTVRWGPRAIDVDILFIDDVALVSPDLTLPHPDMFNRAFVLVPLAEIAGEAQVSGREIRAALKELAPDPHEVRPLEP